MPISRRMNETEKIGSEICRNLPRTFVGGARFWGVWFSRPHGFHHLTSCEFSKDLVRLRFDEGETLSIWAPRGLAMGESTLRISDADRVRWDWFYYGRSKVPANLRFREFVRSPEGIVATTNGEWYDREPEPAHWRPPRKSFDCGSAGAIECYAPQLMTAAPQVLVIVVPSGCVEAVLAMAMGRISDVLAGRDHLDILLSSGSGKGCAH